MPRGEEPNVHFGFHDHSSRRFHMFTDDACWWRERGSSVLSTPTNAAIAQLIHVIQGFEENESVGYLIQTEER